MSRGMPIMVKDLPTEPEGMRAIARQGACPLCGRGPYKVVAIHVARIHDVGWRDFCDLLEVPYETHFVDEGLRETKSQWAKGVGLADSSRRSGPRKKFQRSDAAKKRYEGKPPNWQEDPPHGTSSRYRRLKCRCEECRAWKRRTSPYSPAVKAHQCARCGEAIFRPGFCGGKDCQRERQAATLRAWRAAKV